ncbi:TPA: hypothetical protein KO123_002309 [Clostridioides difficile]|nr:hypothetical protein [Clostridioides difficile]
MIIKFEDAYFGRNKVYDCLVCKSKKDYQTSQMQVDSYLTFICDDCMEKLAIKLEEKLKKSK